MKLTTELSNLTQTTAEELLRDMIACVQKNYKEFIERMVAEGMYDTYEQQTNFIRRLMFFDQMGDTMSLRQVLRTWVFWGPSGNKITRANDLENFSHLGWYRNDVEKMEIIREKILKENPILTSPALPENDRLTFLNKVLKNHPEYIRYEKDFTKQINGICAGIVSKEVNGRGWFSPNLESLYK